MNRSTPSSVVSGGSERVRAAERTRIEREVRALYAPELAAAGLWRRFLLWIRMRREVNRKLREEAPSKALYAAQAAAADDSRKEPDW